MIYYIFELICLTELIKRTFVSWRYGPLAQLVEQLTFNQLVAGSTPAGLTKVFKTKYSHSKTLPTPFYFLKTLQKQKVSQKCRKKV